MSAKIIPGTQIEYGDREDAFDDYTFYGGMPLILSRPDDTAKIDYLKSWQVMKKRWMNSQKRRKIRILLMMIKQHLFGQK